MNDKKYSHSQADNKKEILFLCLSYLKSNIVIKLFAIRLATLSFSLTGL